MPLTALGWGRTRVCHPDKCEHTIIRFGDHWYHCEFLGQEKRIECSPEFRNGPDSNCPAGKWAGIQPIDVVKDAEKAHLEAVEKDAARHVAVLRALGVTTTDQQAVRDPLAALATDGKISRDLAAAIEDALVKEDAARES